MRAPASLLARARLITIAALAIFTAGCEHGLASARIETNPIANRKPAPHTPDASNAAEDLRF